MARPSSSAYRRHLSFTSLACLLCASSCFRFFGVHEEDRSLDGSPDGDGTSFIEETGVDADDGDSTPDGDGDGSSDTDADTDADADGGPLPCEPGVLWDTDFDLDPTVDDNNGDGFPDWILRDGGAFPIADLSGGIWSVVDLTLDTNPYRLFSDHIVGEVRFRTLSNTGEAQFWLWVGHDPGDSSAILLHANLSHVTAGQHLDLFAYRVDEPILSHDIEHEGFVTLTLDVSNVNNEVVVSIDGHLLGTYDAPRSSTGHDDGRASLWSTAVAEYDSVRIIECRE